MYNHEGYINTNFCITIHCTLLPLCDVTNLHERQESWNWNTYISRRVYFDSHKTMAPIGIHFKTIAISDIVSVHKKLIKEILFDLLFYTLSIHYITIIDDKKNNFDF